MNCNVWKPCDDQCWQDELQFSIWILFGESAFVIIHLLCYWPTIHYLILKICPKYQVISSHFFKVNDLLNEHCAKIVQSENISTPIYVECDKMYWSKVCVQEFWYWLPSLDIQPELSEIDNSAPKKAVRNSSSNMTIHIPFFSCDRYESMAEWLRLVVNSQETRVRLLHGLESFCQRLGHFAWHWARQCTDTRAFILLCSL